MKPSSPLTYARAKRMRREPTIAERKLWGGLRNRSLGGFKFYRQVPIGSFIVDFVNYEFGVVIEVDGDSHADDVAIAFDTRRTAFLAAQGFFVHRVTNRDVLCDTAIVLDAIGRVVADRARMQTK
jgi:very-short-patch-repair endonuclease